MVVTLLYLRQINFNPVDTLFNSACSCLNETKAFWDALITTEISLVISSVSCMHAALPPAAILKVYGFMQCAVLCI